jgi:hypothetical protein
MTLDYRINKNQEKRRKAMENVTYDSIMVTKDAPLIVSNPTDTMHYGTVYLEEGAYIELRVGSAFQVESLQSFPCFGVELPQNVKPYPTLMAGEALRETAGYDIIVTGSPAAAGIRGQSGGIGGGCGQHGSDGQSPSPETRALYTLNITSLERDLKVLSIGASGGDGGIGGIGGNGWDGDFSYPGTVGGNGGNGGNGSNGADAIPTLQVLWNCAGTESLTVDCKASPGGKGGDGGKAGQNGAFYEGTQVPAAGNPGSQGNKGKAGRWIKGVDPVQAKALTALFSAVAASEPIASEPIASDEQDRMLNSRNVTLDFANPSHAQAFLTHFGGEAYLSAHYPAFYRAFEKTLKAAKAKQLTDYLPDGTIEQTFNVTSLNTNRNEQVAALNGNNAITTDIYNETYVHDATPKFSLISGEMQDVAAQCAIGTFAFTSSNKNISYPFHSNPLDFLGMDGKEFREHSTRMFISHDATLGAEDKYTDAILLNGYNSVISEINIDTPKSTIGSNPLIYLYDRSPVSGETTDKYYSKSEVDYHDDNTVNTLLGISGSVTYNKDAGVLALCGYAQKTDTSNRSILIEGTGAATYNYTQAEMASYFDPIATRDKPVRDNLTVKFKFPDDWKCRLQKYIYDNKTKSTIFDLAFSYYYTVILKGTTTDEEILFDLPITIRSLSTLGTGEQYYKSTGSTTVYIPPIKVRWGCFAADTLIQMADGSKRRIDSLKIGEKVATPQGSKPILEICTGMEQSLIYLETADGNKTRVTKNHPVITKGGITRAIYVQENDEILLAKGGYTPVVAAYEIEYSEKQLVYTMEVDGGLVYADGYLSGEFSTQNDLDRFISSDPFHTFGSALPVKKPDETFSEEAKAAIADFKALSAERFGLNL